MSPAADVVGTAVLLAVAVVAVGLLVYALAERSRARRLDRRLDVDYTWLGGRPSMADLEVAAWLSHDASRLRRDRRQRAL